jgi:GMP synthase (glutamine-hydrolysing)
MSMTYAAHLLSNERTELMKILAVIPGSMEGLGDAGTIGEVVEARGGDLRWTYRVRGDALPKSPASYDGLIVFGGEISVYDERFAGYFHELAKTIRAFHDAQKPILGSCLGAQSVAHAFGAKVAYQGFFEYGFALLQREEAARQDPLLKDAPDTVPLFEMHGDTFSLPEGSVRLLRGNAVENQAFRIGNSTYGFQCHFEVTPEIVKVWSDRELLSYTQSPSDERKAMVRDVLASFTAHGDAQRSFALVVTNAWMDLVAKQASCLAVQAE